MKRFRESEKELYNLDSAKELIDEEVKIKNTSYSGHYVLLYDVDDNYVHLMNPSGGIIQRVLLINLELARRVQGTDQDTVFIYN
ncbi:UNKNOWN [Stylonychia lemnae]|uniref:Uncharacterized protein n=1 Tax=Stylonychia lemnae TaxID=5949 RepID=A0A078AIP5_STYLE|nr:UNKNOWN [Stylonychia lemnae]|eukprot:CDW80683.1 UNKNOWN [Stylonychia lemnae]